MLGLFRLHLKIPMEKPRPRLTSPLEVDVIICVDCHASWNEVILHRGEGLDNVATLATHVQVLDGNAITVRLCQHCAWHKLEDVRAVLEGTSKLGGVYGQAQSLVGSAANVDVGVLLNRGSTAKGTEEEKRQRAVFIKSDATENKNTKKHTHTHTHTEPVFGRKEVLVAQNNQEDTVLHKAKASVVTLNLRIAVVLGVGGPWVVVISADVVSMIKYTCTRTM